MLARGANAANQLADRAGRHRRIAAGFMLLSPPVGLMGVGLWQADGISIFALCHFVVAASFLWLAYDLVDQASLVDRRGLPHPSLGTLLAGVLLLCIASTEMFKMEYGSARSLALSLVMLGASLVMLTIADRRTDPAIALIGRVLLICGGLVLGFTQLVRMANGFDPYPLYSVGLGVVGLLLLTMALFETRLLMRAVQYLTK